MRDINSIMIEKSLLFLDGKEEFEFWGELFLAVQSVGKVYSSDSAVGVDGHAKGFDVIAAIGSTGEVGQVELDLVPALVEPHGHGADEWLDAGGGLVVGGPEAPADVLIIEDLHFEGEVFLELNGRGSTFLMIMTRKGSLMPSVYFSTCGQVTKAVVTLVPMISSTEDWIS